MLRSAALALTSADRGEDLLLDSPHPDGGGSSSSSSNNNNNSGNDGEGDNYFPSTAAHAAISRKGTGIGSGIGAGIGTGLVSGGSCSSGAAELDDVEAALRVVRWNRAKERIALRMLFMEALLGTVACLLAAASDAALGFFCFLSLGCIIMFTTVANTNMLLLWSVPPAHRSFAMAMSCAISHVLGDVPSPTIVGYLADKLGGKSAIVLVVNCESCVCVCVCVCVCCDSRR